MINPKLLEFCKNLTGIEQKTVDKAEVFQDVLVCFESWIKSHLLGKCDFYYVFLLFMIINLIFKWNYTCQNTNSPFVDWVIGQ